MKNILLLVLTLLCLFLLLSLNFERAALRRALSAQEVLDSDLKRTLTLKNRVLTYKARKDGLCKENSPAPQNAPLEKEVYYIPPEGSLTYREFLDGGSKIKVKNYGFTLRFYAGAVYAARSGFAPAVGARLFYFGRWGAGAAYSLKDGFLLSAQRRLDDIAFLHNTAVFIGANKNTAAFGAVVFL